MLLYLHMLWRQLEKAIKRIVVGFWKVTLIRQTGIYEESLTKPGHNLV